MNRKTALILLSVMALLMGGCASHPKTVAATLTVAMGAAAADATGGVADGSARSANPLPAAPCTDSFVDARGFRLLQLGDQTRVRGDARRPWQATGADRSLRARLEGNTDTRGTPEYNVALGERRAQAVKRVLLLDGASDEQMGTASYGVERLAVEGDDEAAWSQNRRVDIVYLPRP